LTKQRSVHIAAEELGKLFLFKGIESENVIGLLKDCPVVCLEKDELLISQGDVNHCCYFILSGSLRIHLDSLESNAVSILNVGESVGEISLLDGQLASAYVVCHQTCQLLVLEDDVFWSLVNGSHHFSRNLLFLTVRRLRDSNASISESFKKQRHYKLTATIDELTGLYNRRWVKNMLDRQMKRSRFSSDPLSILLVDADHFKKINDNFGHAAGDEVLRVLSRTMVDCVRPTDLVSRYGGEEFIVILPGTSRPGSIVVAERLREAVSAVKIVSGEVGELPQVTISIGLAQMEDDESMEEFIIRADKALYVAKENGRNRVKG